MITLNGKKFAKNKSEFLNSLFEADGTCVGYYRVNTKTISLMNHQKTKVGVITSYKVLALATQQDGEWWYSYGTIPLIGEYPDYGREIAEITKLVDRHLKEKQND